MITAVLELMQVVQIQFLHLEVSIFLFYLRYRATTFRDLTRMSNDVKGVVGSKMRDQALRKYLKICDTN